MYLLPALVGVQSGVVLQTWIKENPRFICRKSKQSRSVREGLWPLEMYCWRWHKHSRQVDGLDTEASGRYSSIRYCVLHWGKNL